LASTRSLTVTTTSEVVTAVNSFSILVFTNSDLKRFRR
jgi:hypothetical protein